MPDRLPPLTALRAFEAAARHLSFAKAAEELNVTPAALSFQIKSLEAHFGQPLFLRLNRAVELTAAGKALSPGTTEGFDRLAAAWRSARRLSESNTLSVTAGPAFTAKWLAPRLFQFAQDHPEIELRFAATLKIVDLARDDVDVAIRFGRGPDVGLHSRPLAQEWLTPVMTPELHRRYPTVESLKSAPLLHDDSIAFLDPPCDWAAWFRAVGEDFAPTRGARFTQADHAIDAALNGAGVVLGRRGFIVKDIAEGRLVAPFRTALAIDAHFRFVCLPGTEDRPAIRAFHDWIIAEIAKLAHISEEFTFVDVKDVSPK
ncbi:Glycine cleavage system transcriptional activator [Pseudoruegeria aquimaris]|uniref:Glycine cleavage system transcriptional activator n=1 Tax=Pseudoruegeria aquimaris TaxID=393663 RepID=A0A1Y5TRQ6_9RHOB|nr:transcriptional regulator GcvA [Pseudoruegeria aquimaris]SLN68153.1 Glycine cleavage system transcriptional activator [Pseudoruegeria aquimaris]